MEVEGPPLVMGAGGPPGKVRDDRRAAQDRAAGKPARPSTHSPESSVKRFYDAELIAKTADDLAGASGVYAMVPAPARPTPAQQADAAAREAVAKKAADDAYTTIVNDAKGRGDKTIPPRPPRAPLAPLPDPTFPEYYERVQARMLDTGFTLTYANCSDFFLSSGTRQSVLLTLKDAIVTVGTIATGILALVDFKSSKTQSTVLAVVGLGTTAATATIDIYTQRFLFGAENVDAVRDLTLAALAADQREFQKDPKNLVYDKVIRGLLDNQAICTPRHIALLARKAIASGAQNVQAYTPTAQGELAAQTDANVRARLASNLKLSTLSDDQLFNLWWLAIMATDKEQKALRDDFPGLDPAEPSASTISWLRALSPATQAGLRERVATARLETAKDTAEKADKAAAATNDKKAADEKVKANKAVVSAQSDKTTAENDVARISGASANATAPASATRESFRPTYSQPTIVTFPEPGAKPK